MMKTEHQGQSGLLPLTRHKDRGRLEKAIKCCGTQLWDAKLRVLQGEARGLHTRSMISARVFILSGQRGRVVAVRSRRMHRN